MLVKSVKLVTMMVGLPVLAKLVGLLVLVKLVTLMVGLPVLVRKMVA